MTLPHVRAALADLQQHLAAAKDRLREPDASAVPSSSTQLQRASNALRMEATKFGMLMSEPPNPEECSSFVRGVRVAADVLTTVVRRCSGMSGHLLRRKLTDGATAALTAFISLCQAVLDRGHKINLAPIVGVVWEQCDKLAQIPLSTLELLATDLADVAETLAGAHSELADSMGMGVNRLADQFGSARFERSTDDSADDRAEARAAADDAGDIDGDDSDSSDDDDDDTDEVWLMSEPERTAGRHALHLVHLAADCTAAASLLARALAETLAAAPEGILIAEAPLLLSAEAAGDAATRLQSAGDELVCACEPPQDADALRTHAATVRRAALALAEAMQATAAAAAGGGGAGGAAGAEFLAGTAHGERAQRALTALRMLSEQISALA